MPTPLATPDTVTGTADPSGPGTSRRTVAHLAFESVVRRASATASNALSWVDRGPLASAVRAGSMRSMG